MAHSVCDNCHGTKREPDGSGRCRDCKGTGGHDEYTLEDVARRAGVRLITTADGVTALDTKTGAQGTGTTIRDAIDDLLKKVSE